MKTSVNINLLIPKKKFNQNKLTFLLLPNGILTKYFVMPKVTKKNIL